MRKTMYAVLGMITWRIAKRQIRKRARATRDALPI